MPEEKLECRRLGRSWIFVPRPLARASIWQPGRRWYPPAVKPVAIFEVRLVEDWIEVLV